ncbi:MAG: YoaK family protein [Rubrobacteraceae bacterium]
MSRRGVLLLLACTAGCVDALSFLGLGGVFTANMTGHAVLFGIALAQGNTAAVMRFVAAFLGFSTGVAIGGVVIDQGRKDVVWAPVLVYTLILEWIILVIFAAGWLLTGQTEVTEYTSVLIVLAALAMGIQSAFTIRLIREVKDISTTYLTSMLCNAILTLVWWRTAERQTGSTPGAASVSDRRSANKLRGALWLVYLIGAFVAAAGNALWHPLPLMLPVICIAGAIVITGRHLR